MPRDRRPEFKSQVRIKGRVVGLKKGLSKDVFMSFHEDKRKAVAEGYFIGFIDAPCNASSKAAARADGLIAKSDSEHYANLKSRRAKEMGHNKGSI